jgi:hypothetical protein
MAHSIDAQTNSLSLFSVIEEIHLPGPPSFLMNFSVVTLWKRQPREEGVRFTQRVRILGPEGEPVVETDVDFAMERVRHRVLLTVAGTPFKKSGCHSIEISLRRSDEQEWPAPTVRYPVEVRMVMVPTDGPLLGRQGQV